MEEREGKPRIRLRYASLLLFVSRVYSLVVGLLFTIIATRRLTVEEFGLWNYISVVAGYWLLPLSFIGYWVTRFTARGERTGFTSILMSLILSISIPILFMASSPLIFRQVDIGYLLLILISVKLVVVSLSSPFNWIASGLKPDILAFAYVVFDSFKLLSAYILVAIMRLGLAGVILAVSIGYVSKAILLYVSLRWFITGSINTRMVKRILKGIWIPIYGSIPSIISSLDAIIIVGMTGVTDSLAFVSAVRTVGSPISLSLAISTALYPKLLAEGRLGDVEEAMRLVYMLSIPSSLGIILLAPHILSILRSEYAIASAPLAIYAILQLISIASNIAVTTASGLEKVDLDEYAGFKDYARSRLFKIANMHMISSLMYVGVLTCLLYYQRNLPVSKVNPLLSTTWIWIISVTVSAVFTVVYAYRRLLKGIGRIKAPWPSIIKYILASISMTIPVYALQPRVFYLEIMPLLIGITPAILSGIAVYFAILYLIDPWFRGLISKLISTISRRTGGS
ncbi:MAG: hypothetical protein QW374_01265 [Candidatus Bathyarchaeia archaeon]|nr:hypothetical protein [Candidatus Bathyarchaeota archaeon]